MAYGSGYKNPKRAARSVKKSTGSGAVGLAKSTMPALPTGGGKAKGMGNTSTGLAAVNSSPKAAAPTPSGQVKKGGAKFVQGGEREGSSIAAGRSRTNAGKNHIGGNRPQAMRGGGS